MATPNTPQTFRWAGYPALTKKFDNPDNLPYAIVVGENERVEMLDATVKGDWIQVWVIDRKIKGFVPKAKL